MIRRPPSSIRAPSARLLTPGLHAHPFTHTPLLHLQDSRLSDVDEGSHPDKGASEQTIKSYTDEFAYIREKYDTPRYPVVLCHGLFGFDTMHIGAIEALHVPPLAVVAYWRGIVDALTQNGIEVLVTRVPRSATIAERAEMLHSQISEKLPGRVINLIGHSMGGLDARYLISNINAKDPKYEVKSLTTVGTPHRGSSFADWTFAKIPPPRLPGLYSLLNTLGLETGAFEQLQTRYLSEKFNPSTPDCASVNYFSYGANFTPGWFSAFRGTWGIVNEIEGPNDGLVSVESAKWGKYQGTIDGCSHLDIINWTNRIRYNWMKMWGTGPKFNGVAFYLHICDMLAKEGL
ncbi:lipase 2 [Saitoella coloradoensis]